MAVAILTWAWPVRAAIQLEYFDVLTIGETLRLEWGTVVENDLAAFEIYCKEEEEPLSAYHIIGTRLAQGSKEEGAQYHFDVTAGIQPGVAYCFRLKEITIDGRRGDILDFCGYGLNITPDTIQTFDILPTVATTATLTTSVAISPTQVFTIVGTPTLTLTPVTFEIPATATTSAISLTTTTAPTPTVMSSNGGILVLPTETPTPIITPSPTATPTIIDESTLISPTLGVSPTLDVSPTLAVSPTLEASPTLTEPAQLSGQQESPLPSPTLTPAPAETPNPEQESTPTETLTTTAALDNGQSFAMQSSGTAGDSSAAGVGSGADVNRGANPPYIVLTATPVDAPVPIAPTFTPYPTAIAMSEVNFLAATLPSQNLMILLLCGIFSGASGLGVLGVVTTLLYMRSRSSEQRDSRRH